MNAPEAGYTNRWISSKLKGAERKRLVAYMGLVAGVGFVFSAFELLNYELPDPYTTAIFAILGIISFNTPIRLAPKVHIHATWPILFPGLYCYGLPLAILTGVPSVLSQAVFLSKPWLAAMFNAGQLAISLGLADITIQCVRGITPYTITYEIIGLVVAMIIFDLCNITLVSIAVSKERQEKWQVCFGRMAFTSRRSLIPFMYLLSLTGALLCSFIGKIGLLISIAYMVAVFYLMRFQSELDMRTEESRTDPLTKAFNYRYLEDWLHREFPKLVAEQTPCSFVFIDLDGLKKINDQFGHEAGDTVLIHVTRALFSVTRQEDVIIRYGGDEFIIICPSADIETAEALGKRLIAVCSAPVYYEGKSFNIGLSVGISAYPNDSDVGRDLIRLADWAMYHAKKDGGNKVCKASDL
ncbi:MAG TPA: GGDEF domain-containing protein [Firmicutes bacterium]|nr:GGDEF domain-containing protein [Candidatus Fermentithermobacillaceae bacterium]